MRMFQVSFTALALCVFATSAFGQIRTDWTATSATDTTDWHDATNWNNGVPTSIDEAYINNGGKVLDLHATSATVDKISLWRSAGNTFQADPGVTLTTNIFNPIDRSGNITLDVDLIVNDQIIVGNKIDGAWQIKRNVTVGNEWQPLYNTWNFGDGAGSDTYTFTGGLDATATGTLTINMNGTMVAPTVKIGGNAKFNAMTADALGGASTAITITEPGLLDIQVPQTALPQIDVQAFGTLAGDVTGAVYSGAGQNVTLANNAILAITNGPEPTEADLGLTPGVKDAMLWKGITTSSGTYTNGDDGNSVYKGSAVGSFTPGIRLGGSQIFQALPGNDLTVAMVTNSVEEQRGADFNSDTGVVNLDLYGSSSILLKGNFMEGTATTINFNNQGATNREAVTMQNKGVDIGQTVNINNMGLVLQDVAANENIKGTLTFNGTSSMRLTASQIVPDTSGGTTKIVLNDTFGLGLGVGKEQAFEQLTLGVDLIDNTTNLLVALDSSGGYDFTGIVSGTPATTMMTLLQNANMSAHIANNQVFELNENLTIGDGKYFLDVSGSHKSITLGGGVGAGQIVAAAGASTFGLGGLPGNGYLGIDTAVDGGGATFLVGSTSAIMAKVSPDGNNIISIDPSTGRRILLKDGAAFVNVPEIRVESGQLHTDVDFTFDSDLIVNSSLNNGGHTITINGVLGGTGDLTENSGSILITGIGTVAAGNSVGQLGDGSGILDFDDGATIEVEVIDASEAGVTYDTISVNTANFLGTYNIDLVADASIGATATSDVYVILQANTFTGDPNDELNVTVSGIGWDSTGAILDFNVDGDLTLTGVFYVGGGPAQDGDFNSDGTVEAADLALLLGNWGQSVQPGAWTSNWDGFVDANELSALLGNWGAGLDSVPVLDTAALNAIPEPATMTLLALGGLAVLRRRK